LSSVNNVLALSTYTTVIILPANRCQHKRAGTRWLLYAKRQGQCRPLRSLCSYSHTKSRSALSLSCFSVI